MKKEIKFSLLYRDMFQSSGKYQPRADQLARIAPVIVEMGCFARVETNGGAFEQVNLLYGENPNTAVRTFTKTFNTFQCGMKQEEPKKADDETEKEKPQSPTEGIADEFIQNILNSYLKQH